MFRTEGTISLLEVPSDLLHNLHSVLGLQVNLRLIEVRPTDLQYPKTRGFDSKYKPLAYSEARSHIFSFIHFDSFGVGVRQ